MSKKTTSQGSTNTRTRKRKGSSKTEPSLPIQFDWRKHWNKTVKPHLQNPFVQFALDRGMVMYDPQWKSGDTPYLVGAIGGNRSPRKGTLGWYQPLARCHFIAFFSLVIGVINYPELDWKFVSGRLHTVPVGYDQAGNPQVVMDILLFDTMTAQESIAYAQQVADDPSPYTTAWKGNFHCFETEIAAGIRESLANRENRPISYYLQKTLISYLQRRGYTVIPPDADEGDAVLARSCKEIGTTLLSG